MLNLGTSMTNLLCDALADAPITPSMSMRRMVFRQLTMREHVYCHATNVVVRDALDQKHGVSLHTVKLTLSALSEEDAECLLHSVHHYWRKRRGPNLAMERMRQVLLSRGYCYT